MTTVKIEPGHISISEHADSHEACAYVTATCQCLEIVLEELGALTVGHKGPGVFHYAWRRTPLVDRIVKQFSGAFDVIAQGFPKDVTLVSSCQ